MSRFGVVSGGGLVLQAEQGEGLQAGAVPAEVAARCGVVGVSGAVEDAGDGVADRREQAGGLPGTQPRGVFAEGDITPVMKAVFYSPVGAAAFEEEFRAGLGGGERGDGQDGLAGHFRAVRLRAGGEAGVVSVAVSGGRAAGGRGVAAADVVPVPFDERELGCSGQLAADQLRDVAADPDGADLVPAVTGLSGRPPRRRRGHHAPGRQPRCAARPLRGLPKTRLDHVYMATALNLLRLEAYWTGTPLDRQRTSHLARLELGLAA